MLRMNMPAISTLSCLKCWNPLVLLKTRRMRISLTNFIYTATGGIYLYHTSSSSNCKVSWIHSCIWNAVILGLRWSKIHTMVLRQSVVIEVLVVEGSYLNKRQKEENTAHTNSSIPPAARSITTVFATQPFSSMPRSRPGTRTNIICFRRVLPSRVNAFGYLRVCQTTTLSQHPSVEAELHSRMPWKINDL